MTARYDTRQAFPPTSPEAREQTSG